MKLRLLGTLLIVGFAPWAADCLQAEVIGVSAIDAGFINAEGRSSKNDGVILGAADASFNYSVGAIDEVAPLSGIDVPRRNFFTFDLSGVTSEITSASLMLFNPAGGYSSPDASETYSLFGAAASPPPSSSMEDLAADLTEVYSIFEPDELDTAKVLFGEITGGPGPIGSVEVSSADDDSMVVITLNETGIDFLQTFAGGKVVLGGELTTLDGGDFGDEVMFGFTKPLIEGVLSPDPVISSPTPTPFLAITTVPEPASSAWFVTSMLAARCVWKRRRKRKEIPIA